MKKLFFLIIPFILIISACSKDIDDIAIKQETPEASLQQSNDTPSFRGASPCRNLISNHDFEFNYCIPGINAFDDCVAEWHCYWGSGDLISFAWDWSNIVPDPYWQSQTFDNNIAFLSCGGQLGPLHSEGIYQKIDIDPNNSYCLSFETGSTYWTGFPDNGNLTMHVQFDSSLPTTCSIDANGAPPSCNPNSTCFDIPIPNNAVYPDMLDVSVDLGSGISEDAIYFWVTTNNSGVDGTQQVTGAFLDNVVLTCRNELITGITATPQLGQCAFGFQPNYDGLVTAIEYAWDFGDNNTSTEANPTHSYATPGIYTVSLTITDSGGCCTTVTTTVMCENVICDYYLCWAGDGLTMQAFEKISGVTIVDQNGAEQEIVLFNPAIDIEGNYATIYTAFQDLLVNQYGLDPSQITQSDSEVSCSKGSSSVPGFFVSQSDIVIVEFNGWVDNDATVALEVPFNTKNCH